MPGSAPPGDAVILLHGIGRTRRCMARLERFLREEGYAVLNLDYPSRKLSLEALAKHIHPAIEAFTPRYGRVHFIGFSLGGLVIRAYLTRYRPARLGRVVLLGTPNGGSEVADFLLRTRGLRRIYRRFYGPAGAQLATNAALPCGAVDYELGVIAGNFAWEPLAALLIGEANDGRVSVASTRVAGMREHRTVRTLHTLLPVHRKLHRWAEHFLREGVFPAVHKQSLPLEN